MECGNPLVLQARGFFIAYVLLGVVVAPEDISD